MHTQMKTHTRPSRLCPRCPCVQLWAPLDVSFLELSEPAELLLLLDRYSANQGTSDKGLLARWASPGRRPPPSLAVRASREVIRDEATKVSRDWGGNLSAGEASAKPMVSEAIPQLVVQLYQERAAEAARDDHAHVAKEVDSASRGGECRPNHQRRAGSLHSTEQEDADQLIPVTLELQ